MKIRGNKKLYWLAVPPLTLAAGIGSIAGANWINSANGPVSVHAQASVTLDTVGGSGGTGIYPGESGVPVTVTIKNTNSYSERLSTVAVASYADATTPAGNADITVTGLPTAGALTTTPVDIAAGATYTFTGVTASMITGPAGNPNDVYTVNITASLVAH